MQDITALLTRENYNKGKGHSISKLGVLIIFTSAISECSFSNQWVSKSNSKLIFTSIRFIIKQNIMSLKYSSTTADYLVWSDAMNLIRKLAKDENYKISLLISFGMLHRIKNIWYSISKMEADIRYWRVYSNWEEDRQSKNYQTEPPITAAY